MSYTIANRCLVVVLLVLASCKIRTDNKTSMKSVEASEVLDSKSRYFTKEDECLIELNEVLQKNEQSHVLADELCLPKSKISFLLSVPSKDTRNISVAPHLKLAILFDASVSLVTQDSKRARFDALKEYLMAIFNKKEDRQISSAEIKVYPFRYCNKGGHSLDLKTNTSKADFLKAVNNLIGTKDVGNKGVKIVDETNLVNLRAYGAVGSTNYLNSFAVAQKFLKQPASSVKSTATTAELKQMLIFSDGLPFTFNDGSQTTISTVDAECNLSQVAGWTLDNWQENLFAQQADSSYHIDELLNNCVREDFFYPQDSCQRPTSTDKGVSSAKAWDDPMNHVLGMIQHSHVIREEKKDFAIYSVHLNNCKNQKASTKFDENFLCQKISENFFRSFSDGFVAVSDAANLKDKLTKQTLQSQFDLSYSKGTATLRDGTPVANSLAIYPNSDSSVVKVTGNLTKNKNSETFDYQNYPDGLLRASLRTGGSSKIEYHNYMVNYNFRFSDDCLDDADKERKAVTGRKDKVISLEIYRWHEQNKYRAWCVLPIVNDGMEIDSSPPSATATCDNYPVQNRKCSKGMTWITGKSGTPPNGCCGQLSESSPDDPSQTTPPDIEEGKTVIDDGNGKRPSKELPPVKEDPVVESNDQQPPANAPPMVEIRVIVQTEELIW